MDPRMLPNAPQGPSDAELNYVPPDPVLPAFGGSPNSLFLEILGPPAPYTPLMSGSGLAGRVQISRDS